MRRLSNETTFLGALSDVGTEDFENNAFVPSYSGGAGGVPPTPAAGSDLVFLGSGITGSYSPANVVDNSNGGAAGRANTTQPIPPSKNYLLVPGGTFTINFSSAVSALGFRATDLGDFTTTPFSITLTGAGTDSLSFPSVAAPQPFGNDGGSGSNDGLNIFYGFIGTDSYTSATFSNNAADLYGLDDIHVASAAAGGTIPEPASSSVWAAMLLTGLAVYRRKR